MPEIIHRDAVARLLGEGAQLVDVLPAADYEALHLPGAINVPLAEIEREAAPRLDPSRPLITYCWDFQ